MMSKQPRAGTKVALGRTVGTPGVLQSLNLIQVMECLARHSRGDWGEVSDEDKQANENALCPQDPQRVLSSYTVEGTKVWVITEWDRSVTTILLPEEY